MEHNNTRRLLVIINRISYTVNQIWNKITKIKHRLYISVSCHNRQKSNNGDLTLHWYKTKFYSNRFYNKRFEI